MKTPKRQCLICQVELNAATQFSHEICIGCSDGNVITATRLSKMVVSAQGHVGEQLDKLVVFLASRGIVSRSKIATVIGISLVEFMHRYDDKVEAEEERMPRYPAVRLKK